METKNIKELYPGYFSQTTLDNIWNDCILVLDTNIYLNLINYPQTLSDELIKIFNSYNHENRLFVPNTVAEEVIKQIDKQLDSLNNSYTTIDFKIDNLKSNIEDIFKSQDRKTYPINDPDKIKEIINKYTEMMKKEIFENKEPKKDIIALRNNICDLLTNVGIPYSNGQKKELLPEIEEKYKAQIIPGYADLTTKTGDNKYNDALIWYQTKDYSKSVKKNILFVTADIKEDWWTIIDKKKKIIKQKQPMINDFMKDTNQSIYITTMDEFFAKYQSSLPESKQIDPKITSDVLAYMTPKFAQDLRLLKPKIGAVDLAHPERTRHRIDRMKRWFLDRYEDPANMCPYDSKEGGYQYIYGGPYDAYEELESEFGSIYSDELIKSAVEELESTGPLEWSRIPDDNWTE